jgi:hypothetical protein
MLKRLIYSIFDNKVDKSLIQNVKIIIVDNDINKTAESTIKEINNGDSGVFELLYFNNPVKGLSNVRNELLGKAMLENPDFIIFVDDDEYVTPYWLVELLETITLMDADAARGPVLADLNKGVSKYITRFFERESYPDNARIFSFTTGNLILKRKSLEKYKIRFDNRFNYTGSEDSFFGIQMMNKGANIFWAAKAIVYESIPDSRANLRWLIKRRYNGAIGFTYILKIEKKYFDLFKKTVISGIYFIVGGIALIALLFPFRWKYWGILKISESIGGFAGLLNIRFHEYAINK